MHAGGWIVGDQVHIEPVKDPMERHLYTLVDKVRKAETTVPNHQLIINQHVIDLEERTVSKEMRPGRHLTAFELKPIEYKKWMRGEITFEQAIGTRQFVCKRNPDIYNLQVFEWMNRWL